MERENQHACCTISFAILLIASQFILSYGKPYDMAIEKTAEFGGFEQNNISMLSGTVNKFFFTQYINVQLQVDHPNIQHNVQASFTRWPFLGLVMTCYSAGGSIDCAT